MKKASLVLGGVGLGTLFCGLSGLTGATPTEFAIAVIVGCVAILISLTLSILDEQIKEDEARAFIEQEQKKDEFIEVWKSCQM